MKWGQWGGGDRQTVDKRERFKAKKQASENQKGGEERENEIKGEERHQ